MADPWTSGLRVRAGRGAAAMMATCLTRQDVGRESWLVATTLRKADFNMALAAGPTAAEQLERAIRVYTARGLNGMVMVPEEDADAVSDAAARRGLSGAGVAPLMTLELRRGHHDPAVRRIADPAELPAARALTADAYGFTEPDVEACMGNALCAVPGVDIWVLRDFGEPVSTVLATPADDVVGLWAMATPARLQRRGHGERLLRGVLAHYAGQRVRHAYLTATAAGRPLYERVGFEVAEDWRVWVSGLSTQFVPDDAAAQA